MQPACRLCAWGQSACPCSGGRSGYVSAFGPVVHGGCFFEGSETTRFHTCETTRGLIPGLRTGFIPVSDLFHPPVGTPPPGGVPAMVRRSAGRGRSILWFQRRFHALVAYPGFRGMKPRGFIDRAVGNSAKKKGATCPAGLFQCHAGCNEGYTSATEATAGGWAGPEAACCRFLFVWGACAAGADGDLPIAAPRALRFPRSRHSG
jgi:hypothetical protein